MAGRRGKIDAIPELRRTVIVGLADGRSPLELSRVISSMLGEKISQFAVRRWAAKPDNRIAVEAFKQNRANVDVLPPAPLPPAELGETREVLGKHTKRQTTDAEAADEFVESMLAAARVLRNIAEAENVPVDYRIQAAKVLAEVAPEGLEMVVEWIEITAMSSTGG